MTNAEVVEMVRAGLAESTIILSIKNSPANFDTSPQALIDLKKSGVSPGVMEAMLSAAKVPSGAPGSLRDANGPADAKALMAKVVSFLGGGTAVNAVKSIRQTSVRDVKIAGTSANVEMVETMVYPDRVHIAQKFPQFSGVAVYRPEGAFTLVNAKLQELPESAQQEAVKAIRFNAIYVCQHTDDPTYSFAVNGSEKIGATETAILEISVQGNQARWNIDPASGRLVRVTRMLAGPGGTPALTRFEYADWRTINGVSIPFKVFQNGVVTADVKSYEINPVISDSLFEKPGAANASSVSPSQPNASSHTGCPIEILEVNPHAPVVTSEDPWGWALKIKYRNVAGKEIIAEKFGANFFNALHEKKQSAWNYTGDQRIKPGETKNSNWGDGVYVNEIGMRIGVEVWPIKIMFVDQTFWEDDGSMQCKSGIWATPVK